MERLRRRWHRHPHGNRQGHLVGQGLGHVHQGQDDELVGPLRVNGREAPLGQVNQELHRLHGGGQALGDGLDGRCQGCAVWQEGVETRGGAPPLAGQGHGQVGQPPRQAAEVVNQGLALAGQGVDEPPLLEQEVNGGDHPTQPVRHALDRVAQLGPGPGHSLVEGEGGVAPVVGQKGGERAEPAGQSAQIINQGLTLARQGVHGAPRLKQEGDGGHHRGQALGGRLDGVGQGRGGGGDARVEPEGDIPPLISQANSERGQPIGEALEIVNQGLALAGQGVHPHPLL